MKHNAATAVSEFDLIDVEEEESEIITHATLRKLARLRRSLESLRAEIAEKILDGAKECRMEAGTTLKAIEGLHAAVYDQNK